MIECKGICISVDVGTIRVGVARCGPDGILMMPVETLIRQGDRPDTDHTGETVDEFLATEVIVGLPRYLRDGEGVSAKVARRYALRVKTSRPEIRIAFVDERLTPNQTHARLRASGIFEKDHRPIADQVAAQITLEQALEGERMSGRVPGEEITLEGSSAQ